MSRPARRSRRKRNEPPEVVPSKIEEDENDEEAQDSDEAAAEVSATRSETSETSQHGTRRSKRARKPTARSVSAAAAAVRGRKRPATASSDDQKSKDGESSGSSDDEQDNAPSSERKTSKRKKSTAEDTNDKGSGEDDNSSISEDGEGSATQSRASRSARKSPKKANKNAESTIPGNGNDGDNQSSDDDEGSKAGDSTRNKSLKKSASDKISTTVPKGDSSAEVTSRKNRKRPRTTKKPLPRADAIKAENLSDEKLSSEGENDSDGESSMSTVTSKQSCNQNIDNDNMSVSSNGAKAGKGHAGKNKKSGDRHSSTPGDGDEASNNRSQSAKEGSSSLPENPGGITCTTPAEGSSAKKIQNKDDDKPDASAGEGKQDNKETDNEGSLTRGASKKDKGDETAGESERIRSNLNSQNNSPDPLDDKLGKGSDTGTDGERPSSQANGSKNAEPISSRNSSMNIEEKASEDGSKVHSVEPSDTTQNNDNKHNITSTHNQQETVPEPNTETPREGPPDARSRTSKSLDEESKKSSDSTSKIDASHTPENNTSKTIESKGELGVLQLRQKKTGSTKVEESQNSPSRTDSKGSSSTSSALTAEQIGTPSKTEGKDGNNPHRDLHKSPGGTGTQKEDKQAGITKGLDTESTSKALEKNSGAADSSKDQAAPPHGKEKGSSHEKASNPKHGATGDSVKSKSHHDEEMEFVDAEEKPPSTGEGAGVVSSSHHTEKTETRAKLHADSGVGKKEAIHVTSSSGVSAALLEPSDDENEQFHDAHMELPSEVASPGSLADRTDLADTTVQKDGKHKITSKKPQKPDDTGEGLLKKEASLQGEGGRISPEKTYSNDAGPSRLENAKNKPENDWDGPPRQPHASSPRHVAQSEAVNAMGPVGDETKSNRKLGRECLDEASLKPQKSTDLDGKQISIGENNILSEVLPSDSDRNYDQYSSMLHIFDTTKLNRVKTLLYATGSRVHRGRGFERIFAEYWDAIMLRLSDRLSSHTSERCDQALNSFLKSPRLRRLHNKFITSIMKRAHTCFVPLAEIKHHIPRKWMSRVPKVVKDEVKLALKGDSIVNEQRALVPHNKCFSESWLQDTNSTQQIILPAESLTVKSVRDTEGESSRIPGALVVDPFVRRAAADNGMNVSDNAAWLLVIALREHTVNLIKNAISHRKSYEHGETIVPRMYTDQILAGKKNNLKKDASDSGNAKLPPLQPGQQRCLNALDIFMGSTQIAGSSMVNFGGSASRFAMERCLHTAFDPVRVPPEKDFDEVQEYIVQEIVIASQNRKLETKPKVESEEPLATKQQRLPSSPKNTSQSKRKLHADFEPSEPKRQAKGEPVDLKTVITAKAQSVQVVAPLAPVLSEKKQVVILEEISVSEDTSAKEGKLQDTSEDSKQSGPRGLGRSAKNLAALLKRAGSTQKDAEAEDAPPSSNPAEATRTEQNKGDTGPTKREENETPSNKETVSPSDESGAAKADETAKTGEEVENDDDAPVRRGKGFGIKNLAAMRARATQKGPGGKAT